MASGPPNKEARKRCWEARDAYWDCLEKNEDNKSKCGVPKKAFEENCPHTWVKYFERRRDYLRYKDKIQTDGYEPIGEEKSKNV